MKNVCLSSAQGITGRLTGIYQHVRRLLWQMHGLKYYPTGTMLNLHTLSDIKDDTL